MKATEMLRQHQKLLVASAIIFAAGIITGCYGYGHIPVEGAAAKGAILPLPAEPSALDYITNNIRVALITMLGGILTFGLAAVFLLFINGVIVGESAAAALVEMPAGEVLVKIVPHGLFEVPAILLAGAGGFLSLKLLIMLLKERKIDCRRELVNAGRLAAAVVLLLAVAGVVEAHITPALTALLCGAAE